VIDAVAVEIDAEAVVVRAARPLVVVSSAVAGGGLGRARALVNLRVPRDVDCATVGARLAEFARRRDLPTPWVGLCTAAATERAEVVTERADDVTATAIATVGLSNPVSAGLSARAAWRPATINTLVLVDAAPAPAALVNLVATVTEAKVLALLDAGVRLPDGALPSGTSTDAIVVAATGRGPACPYGGPVTAVGWAVARAVRAAVGTGARRWLEARR